MTTDETYRLFLTKTNRNGANVPKAVFLLLFNEHQETWMWEALDGKNEDNIRILRQRVVSKPLVEVSKDESSTSFKVPQDYFDHISLKAKARKGKCEDWIELHEEKLENVEVLLHDAHNEPSFRYRDSFYTIGNDIRIYRADFDLKNVQQTYYQKPDPISIKDVVKPDGSVYTNDKDPTWDQIAINKILEKMKINFIQNNNIQ